MQVTLAIPARMASTRLPGKMLADLAGKPLIVRVVERLKQVRFNCEIVVVTDADEIAQVAQSAGARALMSSPECPSGTARIASVCDQIPGDLIINVQGDEPFIRPEDIETLIDAWRQTEAPCITPVYPLKNTDSLLDSNCVKVVRSHDGRALYFSRSPVPHMRGIAPQEWLAHGQYWGHMGVYGYRRDLLESYSSIPSSQLESTESLEQLRLLEANITIQTVELAAPRLAIDTPDDLEQARKLWAQEA